MNSTKTSSGLYHEIIMISVLARRHMFMICETWNLTPVQGIILLMMKPGEGRAMSELADLLGCDASNCTGLVTRLESNGYVERATDENDRRVKQIRLTDKGTHCRDEIMKNLAKSEAMDLKKLTQGEINSLKRVVDKLSRGGKQPLYPF